MDLPCIALLTDFGTRDGFAGVMKGVIYSRLQKAIPVLDISHDIPPQDIRHGAWVLQSAYPYFPEKTVFVAIVDPGVGSETQDSLLCYRPDRQQAFIAPDNGLLTPVLNSAGAGFTVHSIRDSAFYKDTATQRSRTFHGRDVYAPVAAMAANALLANEVKSFLENFGPGPSNPVRLEWGKPERNVQEGREILTGHVVHVDTFGNLITDIPNDWLQPGTSIRVQLSDHAFLESRCVSSYSEIGKTGLPAIPSALPSSGGTLELSLYGASAASLLGTQPGAPVTVEITAEI